MKEEAPFTNFTNGFVAMLVMAGQQGNNILNKVVSGYKSPVKNTKNILYTIPLDLHPGMSPNTPDVRKC